MTPGLWISQQVVAVINGATVAGSGYVVGAQLPITPGEAKVVRAPRFDLANIDELSISVSSRALSLTPGGRKNRSHEVAVQIMFLKKLDSAYTGLEDLLELVYAVNMLLSQQTALSWVSSANDPEFDVDTLLAHQAFRSILTATFKSTP